MEFVLDLTDREGPELSRALRSSPDLDRQPWREATRELDWQWSESYRPGAPRPARRGRRRATPPPQPIAHFAPRSGGLPRGGSARVAGVRLPRGSRLPDFAAAYWSTDEPVADVEQVAQSVAEAFEEVGLWPLLWRCAEGPQEYLSGGGDPDRIDAVDVEAQLAARWRSLPANPQATAPFAGESPGLAAPATSPTRSSRSPQPFRPLADHRPARAHEGAARLLLVPCNRPADALTVLGFTAPGMEVEVVSAVLRSWEERFAATLVGLSPGWITVVVGAPPTDIGVGLNPWPPSTTCLRRRRTPGDPARSATSLAASAKVDRPAGTS